MLTRRCFRDCLSTVVWWNDLFSCCLELSKLKSTKLGSKIDSDEASKWLYTFELDLLNSCRRLNNSPRIITRYLNTPGVIDVRALQMIHTGVEAWFGRSQSCSWSLQNSTHSCLWLVVLRSIDSKDTSELARTHIWNTRKISDGVFSFFERAGSCEEFRQILQTKSRTKLDSCTSS